MFLACSSAGALRRLNCFRRERERVETERDRDRERGRERERQILLLERQIDR
jgi:hypothetical protein